MYYTNARHSFDNNYKKQYYNWNWGLHYLEEIMKLDHALLVALVAVVAGLLLHAFHIL